MEKQTVKIFLFLLSIILNALGNSFMIISNLGSAPWTSAAENLFFVLPFSVGVCVILLHFFALFLSFFMKVRITPIVVIQSMALVTMFGLLIDLFLYIQEFIYIPESSIVRFIYLFVGLNFIAIALSIYFRTSSVYLPTDFLLKAFSKKMKNYTLGTMVWTMIPLSVGLVIGIVRQQLVGIGLGTLILMFGMGVLIDRYNRIIVIR